MKVYESSQDWRVLERSRAELGSEVSHREKNLRHWDCCTQRHRKQDNSVSHIHRKDEAEALLEVNASQGSTSKEQGPNSRHSHGEETDHAFVIKRLENVAADERVINSGIAVVAQVG